MDNNFKNAKVGDYIQMGSYPQNIIYDQPIKWQVIEWRVLAKENNKMLVVSKYGLESRRFDSSSNEWKNSEIRQWANNEFYNKAFNENDKKYIKSFDGDNLFLLSEEEAEKYFANDESRKCKATEYAIKQGADVADNGYSYWWLRSLITNSSYSIYCVDVDGDIQDDRIYHDSRVFRPALWIELKKNSVIG